MGGGRNYPDIKTAKRLATMFDATLDQILGMEDMTAEPSDSARTGYLREAEAVDRELFPLEQKARILSLMSKLSPMARQRILDRAEIYYEIEAGEENQEWGALDS